MSASEPSNPGSELPQGLSNIETDDRPGKRFPLEKWDPPHRGHSHMRIDAEGRWFHRGGEIKRTRMVSLFARLLRREGDEYVIVTPVEKLTVDVEDAPLMARELFARGEAQAQELIFALNNDEQVTVDSETPLVARSHDGPVIDLPRGLCAKLSRPAWYALAELAVTDDGREGVWSCGTFFPLVPEDGRA